MAAQVTNENQPKLTTSRWLEPTPRNSPGADYRDQIAERLATVREAIEAVDGDDEFIDRLKPAVASRASVRAICAVARTARPRWRFAPSLTRVPGRSDSTTLPREARSAGIMAAMTVAHTARSVVARNVAGCTSM